MAEQAARELEAISGSRGEEVLPEKLPPPDRLKAEEMAPPEAVDSLQTTTPDSNQEILFPLMEQTSDQDEKGEPEEPLLLESQTIVVTDSQKPTTARPPELETGRGAPTEDAPPSDVSIGKEPAKVEPMPHEELEESFKLSAADSQEFGSVEEFFPTPPPFSDNSKQGEEIAPEFRADQEPPLPTLQPLEETPLPRQADTHDRGAVELDMDAILTDDQKDRSLLWEELAQAAADIAAKEAAMSEPLTVEEIEPLEEEDDSNLTVAERARARFRATAAADFDDTLAPSFLVDEDAPTVGKSSHQMARHAVISHISEQGGALARALLQRALQGDKRALELCVNKLLPAESLRAYADSLTRKALELALDKESSLLSVVAGEKGAPLPDSRQARAIAATLVRFALEGDEEAMELCLTFSGPPSDYAETIQTLADKLLHKALAGDVGLLELMLKRLGNASLPEGADKSVADSMLERALQGDALAIKACLARLILE